MKALESLPREEAFMHLLARLHRRWRLAVMLPLCYMLGGVLVSVHLFNSDGGLLVVSKGMMLAMLFAGAATTTFLWHLLSAVFRRQRAALLAAAHNIEDFFAAARDQQMIQFVVCDLVAFPGIAIFLCSGDLFHLFLFVVLSMVFYLRCFPSGRKLGEPLFSP